MSEKVLVYFVLSVIEGDDADADPVEKKIPVWVWPYQIPRIGDSCNVWTDGDSPDAEVGDPGPEPLHLEVIDVVFDLTVPAPEEGAAWPGQGPGHLGEPGADQTKTVPIYVYLDLPQDDEEIAGLDLLGLGDPEDLDAELADDEGSDVS